MHVIVEVHISEPTLPRVCDAEEGDGEQADLADDLQVLVAGERVVLQAALHLLVPVSPLHVKLCQRLSATRLKALTMQGFRKKDIFTVYIDKLNCTGCA